MKDELPPPSLVDEDKAFELLRVWIISGTPSFVISDRLWPDAGAWGMLACDLLRQVAVAYEEAGRGEVAARMKAAFDAEWETPTN